MTFDGSIERVERDALLPLASAAWNDHADSSIVLCTESTGDAEAREKLLDETMPLRRAKTCEKLRAGREPALGLSFVAKDGDRIVGTVRLWHIEAGAGRPALLLGPLAVAASHRSLGIGTGLMHLALAEARAAGFQSVLLVGDASYYSRFGFERRLALGLALPGPVDSDRFLGLELEAGALAGARGLVRATGLHIKRPVRRPRPALRRAA